MAFWDRFRGEQTKQKKKTKPKKVKNSATKSKKKAIQKPKTEFLADTKGEIKNWQMLIDTVQDHPLSQARILNTKLLEQLTQQLEQINTKLDALNKLDVILNILQEGRKELESKGIESIQLDKAIKELERITAKDTEAMRALKSKGPMTSEMLSEELKVDRSTASTRLNRLYTMGLVVKETKGRKMYFKISD